MATLLRTFWHSLIRQGSREPQVTETPSVAPPRRADVPTLDIPPHDPLITYFQSVHGAVEIDKLDFPSPALRELQAAGVKMAVPLVSQGELIGVLNLGPRLSAQDYSVDDRVLLTNLATQAAPALRVAQLVKEQQAEVRARESIEQELRIARRIQHSLLPRELPALDGWQVQAYYQPARSVGGDFYDFFALPDGRLGLVIGDVTDKGVPAALVMATTRSTLRAAAQQLISPGQVLERANELVFPDMLPNMFVTCLYAILDPTTGRLQYANAGHDLPYRRLDGSVTELRATGMPLGLMPGMRYEEKETVLAPGENILFYSDGLVEAHNPQHEMFSFGRLRSLLAEHPGERGAALIDFLLAELARFTGPDWEQEDDITLVTLERFASPGSNGGPAPAGSASGDEGPKEVSWRTLAEWNVPSEPGNERLVMDQVAEAVSDLKLPVRRLEALKTAVSEATMNAIEHGNKYRRELPVTIRLVVSDAALAVRISDQGGKEPIPDPAAPDLEAKLAGLQAPRGWGLFLIKNLVDEMHVTTDDTHHTVELIVYRKGDGSGDETL